MLATLLNWISPERRRFMRRFGRPARSRIRERLEALGSPRAVGVISTLLDANLEFLAFALSSQGPLSNYSAGLNDERVEMCLAAMILFAIHLFAREELANNESELIPLLAAIAKSTTILVMVRRDSLRKTPRSEEWMLYAWMVAALGGEKPAFDADLERRFSYNYLAYIGQYRSILERVAELPDA